MSLIGLATLAPTQAQDKGPTYKDSLIDQLIGTERMLFVYFPRREVCSTERLLDLLAERSRRSNLALTRVLVHPPESQVTQAGFEQVRISVGAEGNYPQVVTFLSLLERGQPFLRVDSLALRSGALAHDEDGRAWVPLHVVLELSVFRYGWDGSLGVRKRLASIRGQQRSTLGLLETRVVWSRVLARLSRTLERFPTHWIRELFVSRGEKQALELQCSLTGSDLSEAARLRDALLGDPNFIQRFGEPAGAGVLVQRLEGTNYMEQTNHTLRLPLPRTQNRFQLRTPWRMSDPDLRGWTMQFLRAYQGQDWFRVTMTFNKMRDNWMGTLEHPELLLAVARASSNLRRRRRAISTLQVLLDLQDDHAEALCLYATLLSLGDRGRADPQRVEHLERVKHVLLRAAESGGPVSQTLRDDPRRDSVLSELAGDASFITSLLRATAGPEIEAGDLRDIFLSPVRVLD